MAVLTFYPSSYGTVLSKGTFTNPTNAYSDNGIYAELWDDDRNDTNAVYFGGFDFSAIETDSTINSVTIEAQYYYSTTGVTTSLTLQARKSGTPVGTASNNTSEPQSDYVHQNSNVGSWTESELENIDVYLEWVRPNISTACTIYIDYMAVTVDYTPPAQTFYKTVIGTSNITNSFGKNSVKLINALVSVGNTVLKAVSRTYSTGVDFFVSFNKSYEGFIIERKDGAAGEWAYLTTLVGSTANYDDANNLVDGTTYYYRVSRVKPNMSPSVWSNVESYTYTVSTGETSYKTVTNSISISLDFRKSVGKTTVRIVGVGQDLDKTIMSTKVGEVISNGSVVKYVKRSFIAAVDIANDLIRFAIKNVSGYLTISASVLKTTIKSATASMQVLSNIGKSIAKSVLANISILASKIASLINPTAEINSISATKISDEISKDSSYVEFQTNIDIEEWEVRAATESQTPAPGVGLLVGSGGAALKDTTLNFTVDDEELTLGDRTYTITIYIKVGGVWHG